MGGWIHQHSPRAQCTAGGRGQGWEGGNVAAHSVGVPFSGLFIFGTAREPVD